MELTSDEGAAILVPQAVGPPAGSNKGGSGVAIDVEGDIHVVPADRGVPRFYTLHHPNGVEKMQLSNLYEIEMQIIEKGLLCHEMDDGKDSFCLDLDDGLRSPWSWKWKDEMLDHKRVCLQRFCDIDGNIWILSYEKAEA